MDKRTLLALVLMAIVIVVTPMLFPSSRRATRTPADTTKRATPEPSTAAAPAPEVRSESTTAAVAQRPTATSPVRPWAAAETAVVSTRVTRYTLLSFGATPLAVRLNTYRDLRPGVRDTMVIRQRDGALLHYRLAVGADTVSLDTVAFAVRQSAGAATFTSSVPVVSINYTALADGYVTAVQGSVTGAPPGATLLIDLPQQLRSGEADTLDDARHLAYTFKIRQRDVTSISLGKLDTATARLDTGTITWVAVRNKYFLLALIPVRGAAGGNAFTALAMRGDPRRSRVGDRAAATAVQPLTNGSFAFNLYVGPQAWEELHALDDDLENVNPYAGWLHGVVQPFATIVMRVLLWMRRTSGVNYGWVLVIFGVAVRLLLWPLNQRAMRTSIQMQRLQPELAEVQKRYKTDPDKQREALVKLYQAHGMSPLSPLMGCMPMLLPMPVLFALYFVFQNTIEFRGVQFLWLPDISLRDPYYITPLVMGVSMFVLSWIGMRSAPQNPQTKMMTYMMPAMFTVMFLNFASGLNLYYAVQNIAALPQQWLLSRERQRAGLPPASSASGPRRG